MIELRPHNPEPFTPLEAVGREARPGTADRPWLFTNMVASLDGATAVDGVSGALGGPADQEMFSALRAVASAILVGAATAAQEQYRPPNPSTIVQQARRDRGLESRATIAVVTSSLSIPLDLPLLSDPAYRPVVVTTESAPADRLGPLGEVADIIIAGDRRVHLPTAIGELGQRGHQVILSEGGPSLNGQLIADDAVDEWNLTISPLLVAGDSRRPAQGPVSANPPVGFELARLWRDDDHLFGRWVRPRA